MPKGELQIGVYTNRKDRTRVQVTMDYNIAVAIAAGDEEQLERVRSIISNKIEKLEKGGI